MGRFLLGVVVAIGLTSSAAAKDVSADEIGQFKVGVATADDVIHRLGKPQSVMTSSDGSRSVIYTSVRSHPKAASFIPVVGLFAGGAVGETDIYMFTFGPDGRLTNATSTTSTVDCSTHFVAVDCGH